MAANHKSKRQWLTEYFLGFSEDGYSPSEYSRNARVSPTTAKRRSVGSEGVPDDVYKRDVRLAMEDFIAQMKRWGVSSVDELEAKARSFSVDHEPELDPAIQERRLYERTRDDSPRILSIQDRNERFWKKYTKEVKETKTKLVWVAGFGWVDSKNLGIHYDD